VATKRGGSGALNRKVRIREMCRKKREKGTKGPTKESFLTQEVQLKQVG